MITADTPAIKKKLQQAWLSPIITELAGSDEGTYMPKMASASQEVTAWSFVEKEVAQDASTGGPCRLRSNEDSFISISTIEINVNGHRGKLLIVRDLSALMDV